MTPGSRGTYKKKLTVGTCKQCSNTFEYMRTNKDQFYCNPTCKRRAKMLFEKERRVTIKQTPVKRKLIPYAGKERYKHSARDV